MIQKLKLVFHTVKYLKFRQIFNRLKRRYIKRAINISPSPSVSIISRKPQSFVPCQSRMLGENRFQFLNVTADVEKADDWNLTNQDKLWLYNLHYFDDLNAIVTLGCVIKGETPHFDFISSAVTNGIMDLSIKHQKPIMNGIVTCLNEQQARERCDPSKKNKGGAATQSLLWLLGISKDQNERK